MNIFKLCKISHRKKNNEDDVFRKNNTLREENNVTQREYYGQDTSRFSYSNNPEYCYSLYNYKKDILQSSDNHSYTNKRRLADNGHIPSISNKREAYKKIAHNLRVPEGNFERKNINYKRQITNISQRRYKNVNNDNRNQSHHFNLNKMQIDYYDKFMTSNKSKIFDSYITNCRRKTMDISHCRRKTKDISSNSQITSCLQIQDLYAGIIRPLAENIAMLVTYNFLETKYYSDFLLGSIENVLPIYLVSGYIYLCRYLKHKMFGLRDLSKIFFTCCWISAKAAHDRHIPFKEMFTDIDFCTNDINYIEAHILSKINYDIEIYQEEILRYI